MSSREKGRGRRGGRGRARATEISSPAPLGDIIVTIQHNEIESPAPDQEDDISRITNSQYLTSYNWLGGDKSRIIVPGKMTTKALFTTYMLADTFLPGEPPKWTPLSNPRKLQQDKGKYYRDRNAAQFPTYPLEPMVQAILADKPEFPVTSVDIIGCGNTMGNLLRFARGDGKPFRILVEVLGKTVFFIRRENSPTETIPGIRGYGHTFPEAYTRWGPNVDGSQSHQRVVEYEFAGMQCLVRYEADGFLPDLVPDPEEIEEDPVPVPDPKEESINPEEMLPSIEEKITSDVPSVSTEMASKQLDIAIQGQRIPQCAVFDLKTRSRSKRTVKVLEEEFPRLWLTQTPNFVLGHHTSGQFNHIRVQDMRNDVKQWEETQQPALGKFASLLQMIVAFARSVDNGKIEIERKEGEQVLNLREQGGAVNGVLPPAVASKWDV